MLISTAAFVGTSALFLYISMSSSASASSSSSASSFPKEPSRKKVQWGFMGTARIAKKNRGGIAAADNSALTTIASREEKKASDWAKEQCVPTSTGSYESLLADASIDAVYMPLPTSTHVDWVCKAAAAGKHVLVEKPAARNAQELQVMLEACKKSGSLFMDGVMFSHHDRLRAAAASLPKLGPLKRVTSSFTFFGDKDFHANDIRVKKGGDPLGSVGDLGWYCVRIGLWAFNYEMPLSVVAVATEVSSEGVPTCAHATVSFSDGKTLLFDCGFTSAFRQTAEIVGEKGVLLMDDFVIPKSPEACSYELRLAPGLDSKHARVIGETSQHMTRDCLQEGRMFHNFSEMVLEARRSGGTTASSAYSEFWGSLALQTQLVCDAVMRSIEAKGALVPISTSEFQGCLNLEALKR